MTRRGRWVLALATAPVALILAVGGALGLWLATGRLPLAGGAVWFQVAKVGEAHFADAPDRPVFMLVVGNDARAGVGGARGDALHVIGVNPALGRATILDIPRDTGAAIPGHGTDKINAAFAFGGIERQAQAVGQLVGVDISYAITTNFAGFIGMVDEIGGLDVNVPMPSAATATTSRPATCSAAPTRATSSSPPWPRYGAAAPAPRRRSTPCRCWPATPRPRDWASPTCTGWGGSDCRSIRRRCATW